MNRRCVYCGSVLVTVSYDGPEYTCKCTNPECMAMWHIQEDTVNKQLMSIIPHDDAKRAVDLSRGKIMENVVPERRLLDALRELERAQNRVREVETKSADWEAKANFLTRIMVHINQYVLSKESVRLAGTQLHYFSAVRLWEDFLEAIRNLRG